MSVEEKVIEYLRGKYSSDLTNMAYDLKLSKSKLKRAVDKLKRRSVIVYQPLSGLVSLR